MVGWSRVQGPFSVVVAALLAAPALAGDAVEVNASALNVRTGPSTSNFRIGQVQRGQQYAVLARTGSWVRIQLDHRTGWSHSDFLRTVNGNVQRVNASSLNVRTGASTRYRSLGRLPRNAKVVVQGSSGSWRKISFGGRTAYVHGNYLTSDDGSTPPPPPPPPDRRRSRVGYIQLMASGPGFRAYSASHKRWGRPELIYGAERAAARYHRENGGARVRIGNISLENGGRMPPHSSHRRGEDIDVAPMRNDNAEAPVTISQSTYSRTKTRRVIEFFRAELRVDVILFNDRSISGVRYFRGHHNHFHLRIH